MEIFDLYDENRMKTGETMIRGDLEPDGRYRLVVHIIIFNSKGEMLIQQRSSNKSSNANMWDFSVGGCVVAGETPLQGAQREVFEELGVSVEFERKIPGFTIVFKHKFDDFYIINKDIDIKDIVLQKDEVQAVKWVSKEEVLNLLRNGEFIKYKEGLIEFIYSFKDKNYGSFEKK